MTTPRSSSAPTVMRTNSRALPALATLATISSEVVDTITTGTSVTSTSSTTERVLDTVVMVVMDTEVDMVVTTGVLAVVTVDTVGIKSDQSTDKLFEQFYSTDLMGRHELQMMYGLPYRAAILKESSSNYSLLI